MENLNIQKELTLQQTSYIQRQKVLNMCAAAGKCLLLLTVGLNQVLV